jgi:hypothetical protein
MKKLSISPAFLLLLVVLLSILLIWIYQSCVPLKTTVSFTNTDCEQSLIETDGFICDSISSWNERKNIFRAQNKENIIRHPDTYFFLTNWEPTFHCSHARRIGARGDGGKWVCDPYRLKSQEDCLIYSVGSSGDFSFEIEMKKFMPHCEIHAFDKNPYPCPTGVCTFHRVTFGDGTEPKDSKNWLTIVQELNHTNRFIDILKIDIEGGEYAFFSLLLKSKKSVFPRQILVELHPKNVTIIYDFFDQFRNNHYVIFIKENNLLGGPYFFEYGFLKLNPLFFY